MIGDLVGITNPCIDMDVFDFRRLSRDMLADEEVVEFLAVHVEEVGVSLDWIDIRCFIEINEARGREKLL